MARSHNNTGKTMKVTYCKLNTVVGLNDSKTYALDASVLAASIIKAANPAETFLNV
ncbi:hypothetical protein BHY07_03515 [Bacillus subtilis subsp. subtilis]|nr:hypothetical protein QU35_03525 [Bacillus subtilis subsp. subtilis str. 168]AIY96210.1 hypothetical protein QX56_03520 [Bacillus subtilis]AJE93277.1 hypothetical protein RP72_03405 [Bacillus subtilis subsp. subtilis]AKC46151.1 hypothetical protein O7A_03520 [Bacillus subtilis KCTC 1028 = ATCC 6051a]AOL28520.1 hypothetical protein BGM23_18735 [Bacillus sp. FJAT-14266]AOL32399.1 hypothetical protein BGM20_18190 [Alkalicoccobacillus gibsonii]EXF51855.1 hypothetical protein Y647_20080 [Bacillu